MNLADFRQALADHPGAGVRLVVDDDHAIADHFHVTEVGRVEKRFVDCGGVRRSAVACVLQTLVAHDTDHRLSTNKLAGILSLADSLALPGETPVEVEHQERSVSVDGIAAAELVDGVLEFRLAAKQTACLAEDACGLGLEPDGTVLNVLGDAGDCSGASGCC
ncbi:MAG: DUF6428 family protein [Planctomycetota bacterium]